MKKRLHKLFNALTMPIARLPLIGPHGAHDIKLLLAGAKPVGMVGFSSDEEKLQLDNALKEGRLISCQYPMSHTDRLHFYTAPGFETEAAALHATISKNYSERNMSAEEQINFYKRLDETGFFGDNLRDTRGMSTLKRKLVDALGRVSCKLQLSSLTILPAIQMHSLSQKLVFNHAVGELLQGKRMIGAFAEHGTLPPELKAKLDKAVAEGTLTVSSRDSVSNYMMILYGQPGQEENMRELARLYNWERGAPPPGKSSIGALLGYSDRDEALWENGRGENGMLENKITRNLLYLTQDLRRAARIRLMLNAGPAWKRNMD